MSTPNQKNLIGRKSEQENLKHYLKQSSAQFISVLGRRRIGKTFLIRNCIEKDTQYYEVIGKKKSTSEEVKDNFLSSYEEQFKLPLKLDRNISWRQFFNTLSQEVKRKKKRFVFFFDELPWICDSDESFLPALEHVWNSEWSKLDNLKLIICGSSTSWIKEKIFENTGGLFNRLTARIELNPFTILECRELLKSKSIKLNNKQLIEYYLAFGGVPYYWNLIKRTDTPTEFIQRSLFSSDAILFNEFDKLIEALFRESKITKQLLSMIAKSRYGMSRTDIQKNSKIESGGTLERTLKELVDSNFLTSYVPFGYKDKGNYFRLTDEFLSFYLVWVHDNKKTGIKSSDNYWAQQITTGKYYNWIGAMFEIFCQKHANLILAKLAISGIRNNLSTWRTFDKKAQEKIQIDLVIDRADNIVTLVECKYSDKPVKLNKTELQKYSINQSIFASQTKTKKFINSILVSSNQIINIPEATNPFYKMIALDELL